MNGYCIAVIEPSYLVAVGIRNLLESMVPFAEVLVFETFQEFEEIYSGQKGQIHFVHCFVDGKILFEKSFFFSSIGMVVIGLVNGMRDGSALVRSGFRCIDVSSDRQSLLRALLSVHDSGHSGGHKAEVRPKESVLSEREAEVLRFIAKGMINKEIADVLNIGVTTVVTHRKNITEKLGMKSVPSLTVYAVLNGYVGIDEI